jgi:RND superfamily putative drug exporter
MVRSLTAPLYLLATVALSAGSAVGLTVLVFHEILGQEIYYTTPVFAFVFLVALGEDFNILLMSRIREEVARRGLRAGVARAVGRTGATLSNCGLIMAGTFGVLMQFDVTFLRQIGFAVAAGVLLDTFIIRPLLVPSIVVLLGRWNWVTVRGVVPLPQPAGIAEPVAIG